ncbi:MAG: DUF1080 domain-containing protein [Phycisphaerales bacterium]|nr:DUF1080 domain-containing protein [Phycisphaerales bacterium]
MTISHAMALTGAALFLLAGGCASSDHDANTSYLHVQEAGWRPLFNGRDLTGWTPKFAGCEAGENPLDTFIVRDGHLAVSYENYAEFGNLFGHLFCDESFEAPYDLRMDYRFLERQVEAGPGWGFKNSGVMLHGQPIESMGKDQYFPISIEAQFLGGDGTGSRPTGNVCTPGTTVDINGVPEARHCVNSTSPTFHGEEWVHVLIEVRRNVIRHYINGEMVMEYTSPRLDESDANAAAWIEARAGNTRLTGGTISLQAESHPIEFRNIEVRMGR